MNNELMAWLDAMPNKQDVAWQMKKNAAIRAWCLRSLDFTVGDRVRITESPCDPVNAPGTWHYREALDVGRTGVVTNIDFNPYSFDNVGAWHATVRLDHEWSLGSFPTGTTPRHWHGPVATTPEGFTPPTEYDQREHPDGRKHVFGVLVESLAKCDEAAAAPTLMVLSDA